MQTESLTQFTVTNAICDYLNYTLVEVGMNTLPPFITFDQATLTF